MHIQKDPQACTYREKHKKKWMDGWIQEGTDRITLLAGNGTHLATTKKSAIQEHEDGSSIHIPGYEIVPEETVGKPVIVDSVVKHLVVDPQPIEHSTAQTVSEMNPSLTRESLLELLNDMTRVG